MRAPTERAALAVTLACVAVAACGGHGPAGSPDAGSAPDAPKANLASCTGTGTGPAIPLVHIGPDIDVEAPCGGGGAVNAPIASLSNQGDGRLSWTVSIVDGPTDIFTLTARSGGTCPATGIVIVNAMVQPPAAAVPGDSFDATFTVSAPNGEFPAGTVKVHAQVVAQSFTLTPAEIDFGDIPENGDMRMRPLTFRNGTLSTLIVGLPREPPPFRFASTSVAMRGSSLGASAVYALPAVPGDYTAEAVWQSMTSRNPSDGGVSSACVATRTIKLHARVVSMTDAGAPDATD